MTKTNINQAKKHLAKIREIVAKNPPPIFRLKSKEEVIKALRKTREALWEEKLASRH